jgi:hypothetical protein
MIESIEKVIAVVTRDPLTALEVAKALGQIEQDQGGRRLHPDQTRSPIFPTLQITIAESADYINVSVRYLQRIAVKRDEYSTAIAQALGIDEE